SMIFPGIRGTPEQAIVRFLAETRAALRPYPNVFLGASVFGVSATRPLEVAQDIPHMARRVDYIAPMVYPSHWGPAAYGVGDPTPGPGAGSGCGSGRLRVRRERARARAGAHVPPAPARRRRRLRPHPGAVPGQPRAAVAGRIRAGARDRPRDRDPGRAEG